MNTLYLDPPTWDLVLDAAGNIAVATEPWSLAQDAASYVKTFAGEVYYDTTKGVPYWALILGEFPPPIELIKSEYVAAAEEVPDIASALVYFDGLVNRQLTGQLQITSKLGSVAAITLGRQ